MTYNTWETTRTSHFCRAHPGSFHDKADVVSLVKVQRVSGTTSRGRPLLPHDHDVSLGGSAGRASRHMRVRLARPLEDRTFQQSKIPTFTLRISPPTLQLIRGGKSRDVVGASELSQLSISSSRGDTVANLLFVVAESTRICQPRFYGLLLFFFSFPHRAPKYSLIRHP